MKILRQGQEFNTYSIQREQIKQKDFFLAFYINLLPSALFDRNSHIIAIDFCSRYLTNFRYVLDY